MDDALQQLERLLYGYNYQVFLRAYAATHSPDADVQAIVSAALGAETRLRHTYTASTEKLIATIKSNLEYRGDEGSGPLAERIDSEEFAILRDRVLGSVRELCWSSVSVTGVCFGEGHPAFPVFWGFAYVFRGGEQSTLFIGSSSD